MIKIPKIKIDLPKGLYDLLKASLEKINDETMSEIRSEMSFKDFLIFVMEYYLEREE